MVDPFEPAQADDKIQELEGVIDTLTAQLAKPCQCNMKQFYDLFEAKKIEKEMHGVGARKTCKTCAITFHWDYVKVFPNRD